MSHRKYKIGDIIEVEITGIQSYGIFAQLNDKTHGLIHISEVKNSYVDQDLKSLYQIGEQLKVKILDIDEYDGRISLSLRALADGENHPFSKRKNYPRYGRRTDLGFESLKEKLPIWIKQEFQN